MTVVGVVGDVKQDALDAESRAAMYCRTCSFRRAPSRWSSAARRRPKR